MIGPLPSPRHELFAQAVASGMSASKSYALAYYRPRNRATRASAARLLTNANVQRRIDELRVEAAEQAKASLQVLIPALEEQARALSRPDAREKLRRWCGSCRKSLAKSGRRQHRP